MKIKLILIPIILSFYLSLNAQDQEKEILNLLEKVGEKSKFDKTIDSLLVIQKKMNFGLIENTFYEKFSLGVKEKSFKLLAILLTPICTKYLKQGNKAELNQNELVKEIQENRDQISEKWKKNITPFIEKELNNSFIERFKKLIKEDCSRFKEGSFIYFLPDSRKVFVERKGNIQIEKVYGSNIEFQIEWISNNHYYIYGVNPNNSKIPLKVNIFLVENDTYWFVSKMDDYPKYFLGKLTKIN